jgi:ABC-type amino acid transport substrate-binding protein
MTKITRQIIALPLILCMLVGIVGCSTQPQKPTQTPAFDINSIKSYREIPGVTDEEIKAIEALKAVRTQFLYVSMPSTGAFALTDDTKVGFSAMFCTLLSDLFDIPFNLELRDWTALKNGIDDKTIDFTGEMTPTPERRLIYHMSFPIAERGLGIFTRRDYRKIESPDDLKGRKIGFYKGTITAQSILTAYSYLNFEIVDVTDEQDVYEKLSAGLFDIFIADGKSRI